MRQLDGPIRLPHAANAEPPGYCRPSNIQGRQAIIAQNRVVLSLFAMAVRKTRKRIHAGQSPASSSDMGKGQMRLPWTNPAKPYLEPPR
ncbi:MAG TPA: hypothetical protein VFW60_08090 [Rhodanobacteraceae bacterium]|nr:hypothetical protein [Rhodanobacteraceae bacterium]